MQTFARTEAGRGARPATREGGRAPPTSEFGFNYQGRLNDQNGSANGSYDLSFTLFATNSAGAAVAGPVTNAATAVSNGMFTVTVDFGPEVFTGSSNWLELAVSTNGANHFVTLAPRQQIKPASYAIFSANAAQAATATAVAGGVPASQLLGTVPLAHLPAGLVPGDVTGTQGAPVVTAGMPRLNGINVFLGTNSLRA